VCSRRNSAPFAFAAGINTGKIARRKKVMKRTPI
jgi:hypothetical protein